MSTSSQAKRPSAVRPARQRPARQARPEAPPRPTRSRKRPPVRRSYHHGDLRRALLAAGEALLAAEGAEALSLRAVARRAGVSAAAPYRHFADRHDLVAAIAAGGFRRLERALQTARRAAAPGGPAEVFLAQGRAYVRFARRHSATYRVMFGPEPATGPTNPEYQAAAEATFAELTGALAACQEAGLARGTDLRTLAVAAWSLVHGLALLLLDGRLGPLDARATTRVVAEVTELLYRGIRRDPPSG